MKPYLLIVADVRRRIERGTLRVGDRVPTTREIARTHHVAMATAAHALRALADEGLVRAVPRVGTIVASSRPKPRVPNDTRARIVRAAIDLADREGLGALSLRAVAAKVEMPVMSLYRHVENKDALLAEMTDAALGEEDLPDLPPRSWRARVEAGARAEWRVFRRHPWLARLVSLTRPQPLPNAMRYAEWMFGALAEAGAKPATQMRVHVVLHGFVQGLAVNVEAEADARGETGFDDDEFMARQAKAFESIASGGAHPAFAKVLRGLGEDFEMDLDDVFERGLAALLDGFAPTLR
jgi:AcrR family transcriptional regulator